jgi:hypothetical protein
VKLVIDIVEIDTLKKVVGFVPESYRDAIKNNITVEKLDNGDTVIEFQKAFVLKTAQKLVSALSSCYSSFMMTGYYLVNFKNHILNSNNNKEE